MKLFIVGSNLRARAGGAPSALLALALSLAGARAADTAPDAALRELQVRLLGLERGRIVDAEWRAAYADAERMERQAAAAGDAAAALAVLETRARALALVAGDPRGAVALLRGGRARYAPAAPAAARRAVIAEADILARMGDAPAIRRLMEEFRNGPLYDGAPFRYTVGEGRDTPLTILRPRGGTENSITMTALSTALRRAAAAPGMPFPDFAAEDMEGRTLSSGDLKGRATIFVFWLSGSAMQEQLLKDIAAVVARRGARAPQVVAVCLDRSGQELRARIAREPFRRWRHLPRESAGALMARLGIFGDSEIFVLDADGRIVDRGVTGADLPAAVDRAIGGF